MYVKLMKGKNLFFYNIIIKTYSWRINFVEYYIFIATYTINAIISPPLW